MYYKPKTLKDALSCLSSESPVILAGGTDLMPLVKNDLKPSGSFMDITHIPDLCTVQKTSEGWFLGAAVTISGLLENAALCGTYPALARALSVTASPQIRNMGTIGGNILQDRRCLYFNQSACWRSSIEKCFKTGGTLCHQIPNSPVCRALYYSDLAPVLLLYEAQARMIKNGEKQQVPIETFLHDHTVRNGTTERPDFLLEGFFLPFPRKGYRSSFEKISIRGSVDFPTVNFAGAFHPETRDTRLFAGAVAESPVELSDTEAFIKANQNAGLDQTTDTAVKELLARARLIKEATISVKVKKDSFQNIRTLLKTLICQPEP